MNPIKLVFAAIVCSLVCAASSLATTGPSSHYVALVKITAKGMTLFEFIGYSDAPGADLVPVSGPIGRGADMSFTIVNSTRKPQVFAVLGHRTQRIGPGQRAHLHVTFLVRGTFAYRSILDKGPKFRGVIRVV